MDGGRETRPDGVPSPPFTVIWTVIGSKMNDAADSSFSCAACTESKREAPEAD